MLACFQAGILRSCKAEQDSTATAHVNTLLKFQPRCYVSSHQIQVLIKDCAHDTEDDAVCQCYLHALQKRPAYAGLYNGTERAQMPSLHEPSADQNVEVLRPFEVVTKIRACCYTY